MAERRDVIADDRQAIAGLPADAEDEVRAIH